MTLSSNQRVSSLNPRSNKQPMSVISGNDSSLNYKVVLRTLNELSDSRNTFSTNTNKNLRQSFQSAPSSTMVLFDNYELFNYDFTALAAYLTLSDYSTLNGYNYYSFTHTTSSKPINDNFNVKGL